MSVDQTKRGEHVGPWHDAPVDVATLEADLVAQYGERFPGWTPEQRKHFAASLATARGVRRYRVRARYSAQHTDVEYETGVIE